jgi:hypothetical protein
MHPAQLTGASDAGMIFVLPGNYHQQLRSPFHSQRSYKIKKLTAIYGFIKATSQEERNASSITTSD